MTDARGAAETQVPGGVPGSEASAAGFASRRTLLRGVEVLAGVLAVTAWFIALTQFTLDVEVEWNGGSAACGSAWDLARNGVTDDGGGELDAPSELTARETAECVARGHRAVRRGGQAVAVGTAFLALWVPLLVRRRRGAHR